MSPNDHATAASAETGETAGRAAAGSGAGAPSDGKAEVQSSGQARRLLSRDGNWW